LVLGAVAEVGADRGEHGLAAGLEGVAQAVEVVHALARVGTVAPPGVAQAVEGGAQFGSRRVGGVHGPTIRARTGYGGLHRPSAPWRGQGAGPPTALRGAVGGWEAGRDPPYNRGMDSIRPYRDIFPSLGARVYIDP